MSLDLRDDDAALGVEDLDRSLHRRRGAVEHKIQDSAANRSDTPVKLTRRHRNLHRRPAFLFLHAASPRGKHEQPGFVDIFAN